METILMIKRLPVPDIEFRGDKSWKIAPYKLKDKASAEKIYAWLETTSLKNIPHIHKIVCA